MRSFTESGNKAKEVFMIFTFDEAHEMIDALTEYCQNNKRKIKCKKLLKEMESKCDIY